MQMNDKNANSVHLHYSPTANYSIGYKAERWRDKDWQFHGGQFNYLVKRWNNPGEQANLYIKSGVGMAYSDAGAFDSKTQLAAFTGLAADWETRRYFTSYENRYTNAGDIDEFFMQNARVGIAPYIGDYGDIHTWLMVQFEHNPSQDDVFTITPFVRVFEGEYMAEAGISDKGDALFNWIVRF